MLITKELVEQEFDGIYSDEYTGFKDPKAFDEITKKANEALNKDSFIMNAVMDYVDNAIRVYANAHPDDLTTED